MYNIYMHNIQYIIMYNMYNMQISIYIAIWISYNTHKSSMPYIYEGHTVPEGKCLYIRQSTSDCAITKLLHFQHSKNLPKHEIECSASLYINRS